MRTGLCRLAANAIVAWVLSGRALLLSVHVLMWRARRVRRHREAACATHFARRRKHRTYPIRKELKVAIAACGAHKARLRAVGNGVRDTVEVGEIEVAEARIQAVMPRGGQHSYQVGCIALLCPATLLREVPEVSIVHRTTPP